MSLIQPSLSAGFGPQPDASGWIDTRHKIDPEGEDTYKNTAGNQQLVLSDGSRLTYGAVVNNVKNDDEIRFSAKKLILYTMPVLLARVPYRIIALFSGDFFRAGCRLAEKEWRLQRQAWSLLNSHSKPEGNAPGQYARIWLIGKNTIWLLVKSVGQIAILPLAMIALEFAAIYILLDPRNGRRAYSAIEEFWSRDFIEIDHSTFGDGYTQLALHVSDYLGVCMIPKEIFEQKNLYRMWSLYNENTLRSLLHGIVSELKDNREFYDKEFENTSCKVADFLDEIEEYRKVIKRISDTDIDEISKDFPFELNQTYYQKNVVDKLIAIKESLKGFEESREEIIQLQENRDGKDITEASKKIITVKTTSIQKLREELSSTWTAGVQEHYLRSIESTIKNIQQAIDESKLNFKELNVEAKKLKEYKLSLPKLCRQINTMNYDKFKILKDKFNQVYIDLDTVKEMKNLEDYYRLIFSNKGTGWELEKYWHEMCAKLNLEQEEKKHKDQ